MRDRVDQGLVLAGKNGSRIYERWMVPDMFVRYPEGQYGRDIKDIKEFPNRHPVDFGIKALAYLLYGTLGRMVMAWTNGSRHRIRPRRAKALQQGEG
jgi:hypothetical protein